MSVTAIGWCAAPITSRITPPTPVLAPPNGSTALGWLWVSAFSASVRSGVNCTMPALPTKALTTHGAAIVSVAWRSCFSSGATVVPSPSTMSARKVVWAQCSLHVWASVSSSASVGSRPAAR
jgi:hypothetical protein